MLCLRKTIFLDYFRDDSFVIVFFFFFDPGIKPEMKREVFSLIHGKAV